MNRSDRPTPYKPSATGRTHNDSAVRRRPLPEFLPLELLSKAPAGSQAEFDPPEERITRDGELRIVLLNE